MKETVEPKAIIGGVIHRESIINSKNQIFVNKPGGSLSYAAAAFRLWFDKPGLLARVSQDLSEEFITQYSSRNMVTDGIFRNSIPHEMRAFYKVFDGDKYDTENPIRYFAGLEKPLPNFLLGYTGLPYIKESKSATSPITLQPEHIPADYFQCSTALLCSNDFLSLSMLPPFLRMNGIKNLIIKPSKATMVPGNWNEIPALIRGNTGLICTKQEAINLFLGKSDQLIEIIERIASFGLEFVVITCGRDGQNLFMRSGQKHWHIPAYPVEVVDCIHAVDAFAGGFLAGFLKYYDPFMATIYGNIAASIKLEGSGSFYILDALPEFVESRLEVLQGWLKIKGSN
jgi:sugar/nucleoside kinase (ribokinase family)